MEVKAHPLGKSSLLLIWKNEISNEIHKNILQVQTFLKTKYKNEILEIVPSYQSLSVYFHRDVSAFSYLNEIERLANKKISSTAKISSTLYHIPVCYEEKYALDSKNVLNYNQINQEALIQMHTNPIYKVYFIGFLPGFPYLGGLNQKLNTPRKENPSRKVDKGSVAIGGNQTGIYTTNSPGGWHIIGKSPIDFFDIKKDTPALFKAGDCIKFFSIDEMEYQTVKAQVDNHTYNLRSKIIYD